MRATIHKSIATGMCAVLFFSISLTPGSARAGGANDEDDNPIRLFATATTGPIGIIEATVVERGALTINGREASGGQWLWSGDLLHSGALSGVSVSLESIGKVTLSKGTTVRLATGRTSISGAKGVALIASLAQGEIDVALDRAASAYLMIARSEYASSNGAAFLARVREGHPAIAVKTGEVRAEPQASQHQYTIRPVGHDSNIKVPAGELRRIQVQVLEDDKPVPGIGVMFILDTSGAVVGLLGLSTLSGTSANVITGADGIAAVQFVARNTSGSSPISATVEGTRVSWTGQITVKARSAARSSRWALLILAGAGAAAGIGYALTRDKSELEAQPPVVKNP